MKTAHEAPPETAAASLGDHIARGSKRAARENSLPGDDADNSLIGSFNTSKNTSAVAPASAPMPYPIGPRETNSVLNQNDTTMSTEDPPILAMGENDAILELPLNTFTTANVTNIVPNENLTKDPIATVSIVRTSIPLKQWINKACSAVCENVSCRAASSPAYVESAIRIAISLANQINTVEMLENVGAPEQFSFPKGSGVDWADYVVVGLKEDNKVNDLGTDDKIGAAGIGAEKRYGNEQFEAFLASFGVDKLDIIDEQTNEDEITPSLDEQLKSIFASNVNLDEVNDDFVLGSKPEFHSQNIVHQENAIVQASDQLDVLDVHSAEFKFPQSNLTNDPSSGDVSSKKLQRMYQLALVYYELFSGGEKPSPDLRALADVCGAFLCLPTLTLVNTNNESTFNEAKRRQGPSVYGGNIGLCKLTFQYLMFMGVPSPLCHLIFNLLDSVYGDFSGNESYSKISDVIFDLQLMIDSPAKFLRFDTSSLSSLQLNEISFPSEEMFQLVQSSYQRCISGMSEIALIKGESGTGKSHLVHRFGSYVVSRGGLFLIGKFDQMKQTHPFSALIEAFDQYCDILISQIGSNWVTTVVNNLQAAIGRDASYLMILIPKLSQILGCTDYAAAHNFGNNLGNTVQMLNHLLCKFVDVISASSLVSLTLCIDDLQWADTASISILQKIMTQTRNKFYFIGCYRDDEIKSDHPIWNIIEGARAAGILKTVVEMKCIEEDVLNTVVANALCLSPRLVRSLSSIIYSRTKGNPLFVIQLLHSLYRDGLLRIDFDTKRWLWEEEKICSTKLPDNVALCFTSGINKLPVEVQLALHTLSMLGASVNHDCVKALESQLDLKITESLKIAVAEGLVNNVNGSYHFCHDRIQEASYNMIAEQDRLCNHMMYGICLAKLAIETGDDDMLFTAVHQINHGGPSAILNDKQEYFAMANYNLIAGKKSIARSDYHTAYSFFDNGISFLRKNHWREHYKFSLEIFNLASKSALATCNDSPSFHIICDQVIKNARCFADKLEIYFVVISSLADTSKIVEALEKGLDILSRLGEDIPRKPSQQYLDQQLQKTLVIAKSITDFVNYRIMSDKNITTAMKFLGKLQNVAFFANPILHSCLVLKMVQLTVSHGLSRESPLGFALFGSLLLKKQDHIQLGGGFAQLANTLCKNLDSKEVVGEVMFLISEVQCFLQPLSAANEMHIEGESVSLSAGDINFACFNRLLYCINLFWSGVSLAIVKHKLDNACLFIRGYGHKNSLLYMQIVHSTLMMLLSGQTATSNELMKSIQESDRQILTISFHNMYLAFLWNREDLKERYEYFREFEYSSGPLMYNGAVHSFIAGLASFRLYRQTRDSIWVNRGAERVEDIRVWSTEGSSWNFQHKLLMLEAEEMYSHGNIDGAAELYKKAITGAKKHKFINDEAMALELTANFYLETDNLTASLNHFQLAHECYETWGAVQKADQLFQFVKERFGPLLGTST